MQMASSTTVEALEAVPMAGMAVGSATIPIRMVAAITAPHLMVAVHTEAVTEPGTAAEAIHRAMAVEAIRRAMAAEAIHLAMVTEVIHRTTVTEVEVTDRAMEPVTVVEVTDQAMEPVTVVEVMVRAMEAVTAVVVMAMHSTDSPCLTMLLSCIMIL